MVIDPERGIGGVQSTGKDFAGHLAKLREKRANQVRAWLKAGGWGELWGWRKLKGLWVPRIEVLSLEDFDPMWA